MIKYLSAVPLAELSKLEEEKEGILRQGPDICSLIKHISLQPPLLLLLSCMCLLILQLYLVTEISSRATLSLGRNPWPVSQICLTCEKGYWWIEMAFLPVRINSIIAGECEEKATSSCPPCIPVPPASWKSTCSPTPPTPCSSGNLFSMAQQGHSSRGDAEEPWPGAVRSLFSLALGALKVLLVISALL